MQKHERIYIGSEWVAPSGRDTIDVINASTEEVMGQVPAATAGDVDRAVAAAQEAFEHWSVTPPAERADYISKLNEGLKARSDDIARTIAGEVGTPINLAQLIQAGLPIAISGTYAKLTPDFPFEEEVGNSLVIREPVGVVGSITPWNYPLHQIICKVAAAMAAGCTVVAKPAANAPLSAYILAEIMDDIGLPAGVFNLVPGQGRVVGEAIAAHPGIDMVSFTGSTAAGRRVAEVGAASIKRVALELGGKSASVILDDAELEKAIKGTVNNCYLNQGQTCTAHTRMLVPEHLYKDAAEIAVQVAEKFRLGNALEEDTRLGPLVTQNQRDQVRRYINIGRDEGAELLTGGDTPPTELEKGYFVRPTVFGRVAPKSTIAQEEIFGPVLSILTYRDDEEAVRIANDSIYGLAGGVWGSDDRARAIARRMRTGQIDINGGSFNPMAPFGGFKQSGLGREMGKFGLEEFLEYKSLQL